MQLSCITISTISEQTKSSLHLSLFNYEYHRVRLKWFLSLCCIMYQPCTYLAPKQHCLQIDRSKISYDTRHLGVPSCASRLISKHLVCSMQTVHLSCIKISTISKQTEPSFHLSLFIQEYQIVRPKWFLRLWCIRRKICTYLALKLTMSTNGLKQDSI